jgi:hypothetical protein
MIGIRADDKRRVGVACLEVKRKRVAVAITEECAGDRGLDLSETRVSSGGGEKEGSPRGQ